MAVAVLTPAPNSKPALCLIVAQSVISGTSGLYCLELADLQRRQPVLIFGQHLETEAVE